MKQSVGTVLTFISKDCQTDGIHIYMYKYEYVYTERVVVVVVVLLQLQLRHVAELWLAKSMTLNPMTIICQ